VLLYGNASLFGDKGRVTCTLAGVGSGVITLLFLELRPLAAMATVGPSRFLGVVSYSFYPRHLPILLRIANWLYPRVHSLVLCGAVGLAVMLAVSRVVWSVLEIPFQELCRLWAPHLDRWFLGLLRSEGMAAKMI
jgi:peptidoglycan/LPS O-acetylase OafA/YrhL